MENAKDELIKFLEDKPQLLCATVHDGNPNYDWETPSFTAQLKVSFSQEDYESFLQILDFEYDDGYGGQELFGCLWFTDGTYANRGEYDGSEWWEYHKCPEIPEVLRG